MTQEIVRALEELFPTQGESGGKPDEGDPVLQDLRRQVDDHWEELPQEVRDRIMAIENNFNRRNIPFALYVLRWLDVEDLD